MILVEPVDAFINKMLKWYRHCFSICDITDCDGKARINERDLHLRMDSNLVDNLVEPQESATQP